MKAANQTCDPNRIDDYLEDRMDADACAAFERHLDECRDCRVALEERAADPDTWQAATELLGPQATAGSGDSHPDDHRSQGSVLSVLDSLAPTDDPEMLGRIGEYEVSGVVGTGGMGAVLKAFDKSLRRVVAIKIMAPHLANSGSARARFRREARAAAAITHDNVVDTYGVSEANGLPYLVMPFARGPSLQKRIDESGPLTTVEVVRIGRQIASGLAAAHEQGLVHRDIKPANILLNEGIERLWITDFGVARAIDDASMTQTGLIAGTPQYMSPEQARGDTVDHRSDLFSLGSILYTACTGRPPFRAEAAYGILRRITDTDPTPIQEINPDIPVWFCKIIDRLMAKESADRFQRAEEVASLLEDCLAHLQQPALVELPHGFGRLPTQSKRPPQPRHSPAKLRAGLFRRTGAKVMLAVLLLAATGLAAIQMTEPANIAGDWAGEQWNAVSLSTVKEASNWYNGAFTSADGKQGALHLEWSRVQRRYNGRWKLGDAQSGTITLRVNTDGSLRGAISADPEAVIAADEPRLREFQWQRAGPAVASSDHSALEALRDAVEIKSPAKGTITRWYGPFRENEFVRKGTNLAIVTESDDQAKQQIIEQIRAARRRIETLESNRHAERTRLNITRSRINSLQDQLAKKQDQHGKASGSKEEVLNEHTKQLHLLRDRLAAEQAKLDAARTEFDRAQKLREKEFVSEAELKRAEQKRQDAETEFARVEALSKPWIDAAVAGQKELVTEKQKLTGQIEELIVKLRKAEDNLVVSEHAVEKLSAELDAAQDELSALQISGFKGREWMIQAPVDGRIRQLSTDLKFVKQGDLIGAMIPAPVDPAEPAEVQIKRRVGSIESPVKGIISRLHVSDGDVVEEGDLIAEIRPNDAGRLSALEAQVSTLNNQISALTVKAQAKQTELEVARKLQESQQSQLTAYQQVKASIAQAGDAGLSAAQDKIDADEQELLAQQAALGQLKTDLDRTRVLVEENVASEVKLQLAERKYEVAEAQMAKQQAVVAARRKELAVAKADRDAKVQKATADENYAESLVQRAEAAIARAQAEAAGASADLKNAQSKLQQLQTDLARQMTLKLFAPYSGRISRLTTSKLVKTGDVLCVVELSLPDSASFESTHAEPNGTAEATSVAEFRTESDGDVLAALPVKAPCSGLIEAVGDMSFHVAHSQPLFNIWEIDDDRIDVVAQQVQELQNELAVLRSLRDSGNRNLISAQEDVQAATNNVVATEEAQRLVWLAVKKEQATAKADVSGLQLKLAQQRTDLARLEHRTDAEVSPQDEDVADESGKAGNEVTQAKAAIGEMQHLLADATKQFAELEVRLKSREDAAQFELDKAVHQLGNAKAAVVDAKRSLARNQIEWKDAEEKLEALTEQIKASSISVRTVLAPASSGRADLVTEQMIVREGSQLCLLVESIRMEDQTVPEDTKASAFEDESAMPEDNSTPKEDAAAN